MWRVLLHTILPVLWIGCISAIVITNASDPQTRTVGSVLLSG